MFFTRSLTKRVLQHIKSNARVSYKNYSNILLCKSHKIMAEVNFAGKPLKEILQRLESFAPLSLAESWDNVGLLVDPMCDEPIKHILLTNDLTEDVLDEAIGLNTGLIVSYHPNIFEGLKSVSSRTWKERIVVNCIKHKIAVFSPHTSWDAVRGGVNDWLAEAFLPKTSQPLIPNVQNPLVGAGRICYLQEPMSVRQVVEKVKKQIGLSHLRLALARHQNEDHHINSIALCAGSGNSVLQGVDAQLYLTGEMLHHDILKAAQNGIHVILCNHSDSERGFLRQFQPKLQNELLENDVGVSVSKADHDPLIYV